MTNNKDFIEENKKKNKKLPYDSVTYTTGDVDLNINHFNTCMGTATTDSAESSDSGCGLTEAKRYVRRYYIRPQNIFCSNKAEIVKALIDIGNANCSIYTLNNLGDEKDVSKLMNNDIIYYYDDGILYDKNRVKVMDYDLSIKKEENRKHFTNVDKAPKKEFESEYSDRMTKATELEESNILDEAFNLDFEAFNVFGERLTESKGDFCCICGEPVEGYGNNPEPYRSSNDGSRCCDGCNLKFVIPARIEAAKEN